VASHRPHKRLDALVTAWRAAGSEAPLILLGAGTQALHAPPLIQALGFVSDAAVDSWLAGAACLISASRAEGFGLPILASLAAGVPVVASRHPALEEVGGDAVNWVAPDDLDGLVRAAHAVIADPCAAGARVACGHRRARKFNAAHAAQQLARALE
jgi:glycosyltransferase involved in cell wall biosynthesis